MFAAKDEPRSPSDPHLARRDVEDREPSEELVVGGQDDRLDPTSSPELPFDVRDVVSGRQRADRQPLRDLPGRQPRREEPKDLELAPRERSRDRRHGCRRNRSTEAPTGRARKSPGGGRFAGRPEEVDEVGGRPRLVGGEDDRAAEDDPLIPRRPRHDLVALRRSASAGVPDDPTVAPADGMAVGLRPGHDLVAAATKDLPRRATEEPLGRGRPGDDPLAGVRDEEAFRRLESAQPGGEGWRRAGGSSGGDGASSGPGWRGRGNAPARVGHDRGSSTGRTLTVPQDTPGAISTFVADPTSRRTILVRSHHILVVHRPKTLHRRRRTARMARLPARLGPEPNRDPAEATRASPHRRVPETRASGRKRLEPPKACILIPRASPRRAPTTAPRAATAMRRDVVVAGLLWVGLSLLGLPLLLAWQGPALGTDKGEAIAGAFRFLLLAAWPVFTFVLIVLAYSVARFRARTQAEVPPPDGPPIQGLGGVPLAWFWVTSSLALLVMVYPGLVELPKVVALDPAPDLRVEVTAFQWAWRVRYPETGVEVVDELVLPVERTARVDVTSLDVVHAFWVPAFGLRIDALPGQTTSLSFRPTTTGDYATDSRFRLQCSQLCGGAHAAMMIPVRVVDEPTFTAWLAAKAPAGPGPSAAPGGPTLNLVARDIRFSTERLEVAAGTAFTIVLDNQDVGVVHNVAVYDSNGRLVDDARTAFEPGPVEQTLVVPPLASGTYRFVCDAHPQQMVGELVVK